MHKGLLSKMASSCDSQGVNKMQETRTTCSLCTQKLTGANRFDISNDECFCKNCYNTAKENENYEIAQSLLSNVITKTFKDKYSDVTELLQQHTWCLVVANEKLPYWLQCTNSECLKWHEVNSSVTITPGYVETFQCENVEKMKKKRKPCVVSIKSNEWKKWYDKKAKLTISEHHETFQCKSVGKYEMKEHVECVKSLEWVNSLTYVPFLKHSWAAQYIKGFSPEEVGFYPTQCHKFFCKSPDWVEPFAHELNGESPIWANPETMEESEYEQFCMALKWKDASDSSEVSAVLLKETKRLFFLGLRNLLVILWNLSPHHWLTAETVKIHLICRGLARIYLLSHIDSVIWLLTKRGIINYGLVSPPMHILSADNNLPVVIIGAGIAGLAAARQLKKVGIRTIILEAHKRIGGRVNENENGCHGSQFINGLINNPLTILCHQAQLQIIEVNSDPVFVSESSVVPTFNAVKMLCQFGGIMRYALNNAKKHSKDSNWLDTIMKDQQDFKKIADFSVEECQIFDSMFKFTDVEHRTCCSQLTLKHYEFPRKLGGDGYILQGLPLLLKKLSEGLDIHYEAKVHKVNYQDNEIEVVTGGDSPQIFKAAKVIVTVPLPVLYDQIEFNPPLPESKQEAIKHLGNVIQEKVIIHFPERFWAPVLNGDTSKFCILSCDELPFQYFTDVSRFLPDYQATLVTFITNYNQNLLQHTDENIIEICLTTLKKIFCGLHIDVPRPDSYTVTHWTSDPLCKTAGSFVKTGFTYDLYDEIAKPVNSKIFFAGDATFRKLPNSMTGAFLSGLREAVNIVQLMKNTI